MSDAPNNAPTDTAPGATLLTGAPETAVEQNGNTVVDGASPDKGPGTDTPDKGPGDAAPNPGDAAPNPGDPAKAEGADTPADAPIEYTDFVAPEGVNLNAELLAAFKEKAAANKLSQEDAQAYVELGARILQDQAKAQADAILAIRGEWHDAAKAEFNDVQLSQARRAVEAYGDADLRKFLDETGVGNHPAVIRLLTKAGATVAEDKFVGGGNAPAKPASLAERLYPSTTAA